MNATGFKLCETCQISNGLNSTDQRSIIIIVLFAVIALVSCYVGVLWFSVRTRINPEKTANATTHRNEAFRDEEEDYDDIQPIDNTRRATTQQHVRFAEENERRLS